MKLFRAILSLAAVVALPALAFSVQRLHASRVSAIDAGDNLAHCRRLAEEIESLQVSPTQASLQSKSQQELASLIEQAAQAGNLPPASIVRIHPEANRRVAKTAYVEQPTRVELRQVTLQQVVAFLQEVSQRDMRILPNSLRLSAPRLGEVAQNETWQAEVVLTHVVFSPQSGGF